MYFLKQDFFLWQTFYGSILELKLFLFLNVFFVFLSDQYENSVLKISFSISFEGNNEILRDIDYISTLRTEVGVNAACLFLSILQL